MADDDLRSRLAAALRSAAHDCPGDCGQSERECVDAHPIQVEVLHFGEVAVIGGPVEALADVALAAVAPELEELGHYRNAISWETSCPSCAPVLDSCRAADERAEKAEAQLARVRQYCELTADSCHVPTRQTAIDILQLLDGPTEAEPPTLPTSAELGTSLAFAMDAMKPGAEPVFCHHENAVRATRETREPGRRKAVVMLSCPACNAWAEQVEGEPVLAPVVLNAHRCTEACAKQHTFGPGCQMQPTTRGKTL